MYVPYMQKDIKTFEFFCFLFFPQEEGIEKITQILKMQPTSVSYLYRFCIKGFIIFSSPLFQVFLLFVLDTNFCRYT